MRWTGLGMHRLVVSLCVSLTLVAIWRADPAWAGEDTLRFAAVAPGIGYASFEVYAPEGDPFSGHAFKIDLTEAQLRLVAASDPSSRQSVQQITATLPAVVAVNASFFDNDGRAMGLAVGEGGRLGTGRLKNWGALLVNGTDARIVLGASIPSNPEERLIVQGIPRLVVGGKVPRLKPQLAERTAVCAAAGQVVIVVASKAETTAFARFLADPSDKGGLGCSDALNLDGGPSTQLIVRLPTLTLSLRGGWGVPNALVATPGRK